MRAARKVTVVLPEKLLAEAERATGLGTTSTIRRGLELVAAGRAYSALRARTSMRSTRASSAVTPPYRRSH